MSRGPAIRQADVARAIKALESAGLGVARIEVRPGGVVLVIPGAPPPAPALAPDLTPPALDGQPADLDSFRARRRGVHANEGP